MLAQQRQTSTTTQGQLPSIPEHTAVHPTPTMIQTSTHSTLGNAPTPTLHIPSEPQLFKEVTSVTGQDINTFIGGATNSSLHSTRYIVSSYSTLALALTPGIHARDNYPVASYNSMQPEQVAPTENNFIPISQYSSLAGTLGEH